MENMLKSFTLRPSVNWPTDEEFKIIRELERKGFVRELCPSEFYWEFVILDQRAENTLPKVCFEGYR